MPPLINNIKHEKFAKAILDPEVKSNTQAYLKAYPNVSPLVAGASAPRLLENVSIRKRIQELLAQQGTSTAPERLKTRLAEIVESQEEHNSLKAIDTCLKVYGAYGDDDDKDINIDSIEVSFIQQNIST